jgi:DNA mismatch repair ATPase MutS
MSFKVDQQTLTDLQLFGTDSSVLDIFLKAKTKIGGVVIRQMMETPSSDLDELQTRKLSIEYFQKEKTGFDITERLSDDILYYLGMGYPIIENNYFNILIISIKYFFSPTSELFNIHNGISSVATILHRLKSDLSNRSEIGCPVLLRENLRKAKIFLDSPRVINLLSISKKRNLKIRHTLKYDVLLRSKLKNEMNFIFNLIHEIDALETIGRVAQERNFCFPSYQEEETTARGEIEMISLFHPLLSSPVKYNLEIKPHEILSIITGPNMAGKSTFLKAVGIAVYLGHVGFPVPASKIKIPIFKGLTTTINISDDINRGYSHFYSEIARIKEVIQDIKEHRTMFVIFDELFRGTNVKDAFDGSLALAKEFSRLKNNKIFISTHIVEIVDDLIRSNVNVVFKYFNAEINGKEITYDFTLKDGFSNQRLGLVILEREKIIETIREIILK